MEVTQVETVTETVGRNEISGEEGGSIIGRGGGRSGSWADVISTVTLSGSILITLIILS